MSQTNVNVDSIPNTKHEEPLIAGALNANDVRGGIAAIVKLGEVVAQLTGNSTISKVVSTFTSLATQEWFIGLIVSASSLFDKGNSSQLPQLVASSLPPEVVAASEGPIVAGALNGDDVLKGIESLLEVATFVSTISGNAAIAKAIATLSTLVRQPWFISIVVNAAHLFGK